ncbi:hypothetical protein QT17_12930 [Thermus sp. 2.9]|uniref:ATP-binding protein n=1 Tax=Thermus sp. (strain 2.9) TaxID=1577051 RepID=UPI000543548F|nr:ATP-binding protein [Thermus sp. 2.9]KHG64335.1 hypothetical protein QT17_12930 [Thermus sp. 2.9]
MDRPRYGLVRLFWILPHPERPGGAVLSSLPLDRPTVLVGRNGAGKTSLLRLVAFLFGHPDPDRLVGGGWDFLEVYLSPPSSDAPHRRSSGYVGGHFLGREGATTVIAYAQGNGYRYLVAPGHIEPEILKEGGRFLTPNELHERLAAMGLVGDTLVEVRSPEAYARLFGERFRSPLRGHVFPSLRRVSLGWFLGLFLGETLKEEWIRNFLVNLALRKFEDDAHRMTDFERRLGEIQVETAEIAEMDKAMPQVGAYGKTREELVAKARLYAATRLRVEEALPRLEEEAKGLEAMATELRKRLERIGEEWKAKRQELEGKLLELAREEGKLQGEVASVQEALQKAEEAFAPWRDLVTPDLPHRLEEVRRELALLGARIAQEGAAWEAERQRRRAERERWRTERLLEVSRRKEELHKDLRRAEEETRARLEEERKEEEEHQEAARQALEKKRRALSEDLARLEVQEEPQDHEWREAQERLSALKEEQRRLERELDGKRREVEEKQRELGRLRVHRREAEERVAGLRAALERLRREGSLLRFLERNAPGWEEGLGKLLPLDLLKRDDLEPTLFSPPPLPPGRVGVGEVSLLVGHLPPPANPVADLEAKLRQAEEDLGELEGEIAWFEAQVKELEEAVQTSEQRWEEQEHSLQNLEAWLRERRERFLVEREEALSRLQAELTEVEEELASFQALREALREKWKQRLEEALEAARRPFSQALAALEAEERALSRPLEDEPPPPELLPLAERQKKLQEELQNLQKAEEVWQSLERAREEAQKLPALEGKLAQVRAAIQDLQRKKVAHDATYEKEEGELRRRLGEVERELDRRRNALEGLKKALSNTFTVPQLREHLASQFPRLDRALEPPFPELPPGEVQAEALEKLFQRVKELEKEVKGLRDRLRVVFYRLNLEDPLPEDLEVHYRDRGLALSRRLEALVQNLEARLTLVQRARKELVQLVGKVEAKLRAFAFPTVRWAEVHLEGDVEQEERDLEEALIRLREDAAVVKGHFQHPDLQPLFSAGDLQASLQGLGRAGKRYAEESVEELLSGSFRLAFSLERGERRVRLQSLAKLRNAVSTGQAAALGHALAAALLSLLDRGDGVRLPLLVDEMGRLDGENATALFRGLEELGLILLGATPSKEALAEVAGQVSFRVVEVRSMAARPEEGGLVEGLVARE